MSAHIRIINLDLDLLAEEALKEILLEYLSSDFLNVVHLISIDYIKNVENDVDEMVDSILNDADLVLSGEKAILSKHHVDVLEAGEMVVEYKKFFQIMSEIGVKDKKCCFVVRTSEEAKSLYRIICSLKLGCECIKIYEVDGNVEEEMIINDMNNQMPDLIFLALDRGEQEQWIAEHKAKLNTKLCLCIGGISSLMRKENPIVPKWIRVLHLLNFYKKLVGFPASHFFRKRIFKRRMRHYNSKNGLD